MAVRFSSAFTAAALVAVIAAARTPALAQEPVAAADSARALSEAAVRAFEKQTREGVEESIALFLSAATLYRAAADVEGELESLNNAGLLHGRLGDTDSAFSVLLRVLDLARAAADDERTLRVMRQIGEVHHGLGRADSALVFYRMAVEAAGEAELPRELGTGLSNMGIAHRDLGRPDSALHYLDRAIRLRRELNDTLGIAVTLNNIAAVEETLGRPTRAITHLREALVLRRLLGDPGGEGNVLNNIGYNLDLLGQPDSALHYYSQALPLLEASGRQRVVGITIANIGRAYLALGVHDSALSTLRRAQALKRAEGDRAGEAWALNDLGRAHQAGGAADSAMHYFDRALAALREIGDRAREGATLFHIARFHHRGRAVPELARAVAYYDSAAAIRAAVGARAGGDANRIDFLEQDALLFSEWALAWLARSGDLTATDAAAAALAAAERGRAQALLDLMRSSGLNPPVPDPGADMVAEGRRLADAASDHAAAGLVYLVTPDSTVTWLVRPGAPVIIGRSAAGLDSIADLVADWRAGVGSAGVARGLVETDRGIGITRRGRSSPGAAIAALSNVVLPPDLQHLLPSQGEIVVVPHGPLALLPFAALASDSLAPPFGAGLAIRYAPSLGTLAQAEARAVSRRPGDEALVVGNPLMPSVSIDDGPAVPLPTLPGAEREALWLAEQLGVDALTGPHASKDSVLIRMRDAPIIHLATHGFAFSSEGRARDSFLAFAPGTHSDGLLTVGDILDAAPHLDAELVVLSACQTGLGDLKHAEGTVGLQRAFLARGARAVLVSLWNVSDEATELLMQAFYTHWLQDGDRPTKAEALRHAQESVRAIPRFEHERYWAAFQLVGAH